MKITLLPSPGNRQLCTDENSVMVASFVKDIDDTMSVVGMVLGGPLIRHHFVLQTVAASEITHFMPSDLGSIELYAYEDNCLKLNAGDKCTLIFGESHHTEGLMGMVMCSDMTLHGMRLTVEDDAASTSGDSKRPRSNLKLITLADGRQIGREKTIKAICKWLDKYNEKISKAYNVERVVWCEEASMGSRSQRSWWYWDAECCKKKPFPNATKAVECMEKLTGANCYAEILSDPDEFVE